MNNERLKAPAANTQIYVLCTQYGGPVEWTASRFEAAAWEDELKPVRYVRKVDPHVSERRVKRKEKKETRISINGGETLEEYINKSIHKLVSVCQLALSAEDTDDLEDAFSRLREVDIYLERVGHILMAEMGGV